MSDTLNMTRDLRGPTRPTLQEQVAELPADDPRTDWRTYAGESLADFLGRVRSRGYSILIEYGHAMIGPGTQRRAYPVIADYWQLKRFNAALCVAAAVTHRAWWSYASGQSDTPPLIADVPTSPADPDSFACATCGSPAFDIDDRAVAWCQEHVL